jgi:hypothetical protein
MGKYEVFFTFADGENAIAQLLTVDDIQFMLSKVDGMEIGSKFTIERKA